ncbi:MAG TPA: sulfatase-like hydrolase/transferase [Burkholderiales bacterium]|nr:sulfatase-like hydrolase/transferase [Burkholderiales bacterium]
MFSRLPPLARFLFALVAIELLVFGAFRLAFWVAFRETLAGASWEDLAKALYLGSKFDLRLALLLLLPLALLGWIPLFDPARRRAARIGWLAYLALAQCAVLLLYFVDFGHYDWVRVRLNASIIDHLTPVGVAAQVAWETYPVGFGVLALLALTLAFLAIVRVAAGRTLAPAAAPLAKWPKRAAIAVLVALYIGGIYGKWSRYPLRWSEAYFSSSEAVAALALNPVLFLTDTAENRNLPYDADKVREHYATTAALLGIRSPDPQKLDFARYVVPAKKPAIRYNLVVIHLESLAAFKAGIFGNRMNGTPALDAIAKAGLLFTNFFVPEVPTPRSVFEMLTGIPDVNGATTASRNPLIVGQHTLVNALEGYEKYYFLGGSATWGNIRGLFTHNIPGLRVFEEGDYDAPQVDGWGVSDVVLFDKAHRILREEKKPFFAFIQTAGNHRPFGIPDDHPGFELAQADAKLLSDNGFDSLAAFNGLRYLDFALGSFFEKARKDPYFANTVFVMYGDHGNPSTVQTPWQELLLTGYHVPFVIYAPGLIKGGRQIDTTASLPDALPTSLGLIGVPYLNTALGRDLLDLGPGDRHFSLIGLNGVLDDEFYFRLDPGGPRLFRYRSDSGAQDVHQRYPEKVAEMQRMQEALYETSKYLLYHNPARPHAAETREGRKEERR